MQRTNPDIDIVLNILLAALKEKPNAFLQSLHQQYCERGGLSKKQLEGLHSKASKITGIPAGQMATLEAIIKKKPNRYKSEGPKTIAASAVEDEAIVDMMDEILQKFPQHKRVLFLQARVNNHQKLLAAEITEVKNFYAFASKR
ncbi:MAG: hypothetical protein ABIO05_07130 [Ferruginibacter sp.]